MALRAGGPAGFPLPKRRAAEMFNRRLSGDTSAFLAVALSSLSPPPSTSPDTPNPGRPRAAPGRAAVTQDTSPGPVGIRPLRSAPALTAHARVLKGKKALARLSHAEGEGGGAKPGLAGARCCLCWGLTGLAGARRGLRYRRRAGAGHPIPLTPRAAALAALSPRFPRRVLKFGFSCPLWPRRVSPPFSSCRTACEVPPACRNDRLAKMVFS